MELYSILYSIAAFIVGISLLVAVHEFGHYWVARKMGVKVLRFSIGFGKPLWIKRMGADQTEYVLGSLPFGGFVKMLDEREADVDAHELDRAFNRQSVWVRCAIVVAGPVVNFLFAILVYCCIYLMGIVGVKPVIGEIAVPSPAYSAGIVQQDRILSVNGIDVSSWETAAFILLDQSIDAEQLIFEVEGSDRVIREKVMDISHLELLKSDRIELMAALGLSRWRPHISPVIDQVIDGGAAQAAGVLPGDRIIAIDDEEIQDVYQWTTYIRAHPEQSLRLLVQRDDARLLLQLRPDSRQENGQVFGFIGVQNRIEIPEDVRRQMTVVEYYNPVSALLSAVHKTWQVSWLTLRVLGKLVIGEASVKNISGPVTIAHYAGINANAGLKYFLGFLAIISISLGIVNLLPIPLLDGGHLFYYLIEIVKGSPVSQAAEIVGQKIGMTLLTGLMLLAVYNDLLRLVE